VRSTIQLNVAGDASMFPALSMARTESVCEPAATAPKSRPLMQGT
jgi:hypothetical protein